VILEKTKVLFCYGKYLILILMKNPYCEAYRANFGVAEVKLIALKQCLYS